MERPPRAHHSSRSPARHREPVRARRPCALCARLRYNDRMPTPYTSIAGQSVERLAALSDGVFAIAMTLLVLDLRVPAAAALHGNGDLFRHVFVALAPRFVPYLLSFMSLGIFWIGQQTQLNHFARTDRALTWIQLGFLLAVTLIPFSTALLAEYIGFRLAVVTYWINLVLLGWALLASIRY